MASTAGARLSRQGGSGRPNTARKLAAVEPRIRRPPRPGRPVGGGDRLDRWAWDGRAAPLPRRWRPPARARWSRRCRRRGTRRRTGPASRRGTMRAAIARIASARSRRRRSGSRSGRPPRAAGRVLRAAASMVRTKFLPRRRIDPGGAQHDRTRARRPAPPARRRAWSRHRRRCGAVGSVSTYGAPLSRRTHSRWRRGSAARPAAAQSCARRAGPSRLARYGGLGVVFGRIDGGVGGGVDHQRRARPARNVASMLAGRSKSKSGRPTRARTPRRRAAASSAQARAGRCRR